MCCTNAVQPDMHPKRPGQMCISHRNCKKAANLQARCTIAAWYNPSPGYPRFPAHTPACGCHPQYGVIGRRGQKHAYASDRPNVCRMCVGACLYSMLLTCQTHIGSGRKRVVAASNVQSACQAKKSAHSNRGAMHLGCA